MKTGISFTDHQILASLRIYAASETGGRECNTYRAQLRKDEAADATLMRSAQQYYMARTIATRGTPESDAIPVRTGARPWRTRVKPART